MASESAANWDDGRVGDLVRQVKRRVPVADGVAYPMIGVRLYGNGAFVRETVNRQSLSAKHVYAVEPGDFVYTRLFASKGTYALLDERFSNTFASNEFPTFRAREACPDLRYLLETFCRERTWRRAEVFCTGTTTGSRFRLRERDFLALPIKIPPPSEQVAISEVLASLRTLAEDTKGLLDELVIAKKWAMRELLTLGHPRFRTKMQPLPSTWPMGRVAPKIQEIPAHWQLVQLTKVARLESGHTPSRKRPEYWGGDIPWVSLADTEGLNSLVIRTTNENTNQLGIQNSSARVLPEGTVVFSRTASVGLCSQLGRPMATSQDFANWVCGPKLDPRYLVQVFRHMGREWQRLQAGSTHQTVYMPVFKKLRVLLPSREEQAAIADVGDGFDTRIQAETRYLAELTELKRGLGKELLSGRVRIPTELIARLNDAEEG